MSLINDPEYNQNQYKTSANLDARIALHARFSQNRYGWMRWVFDQIQLPQNVRVLELGSGPGSLWLENLSRLPSDIRLTLSDASEGMTRKARLALGGESLPINLAQIEASRLPFGSAVFDVVIANHMLYHVPQRERALEEIRRVLNPEGRLYATTIGAEHMYELDELVSRFDPALAGAPSNRECGFSLENGALQLGKSFNSIEQRRYPDSLNVTESAALTEYIASSGRLQLAPERKSELQQWIEHEIVKSNGVIHISKVSGIFIARPSGKMA